MTKKKAHYHAFLKRNGYLKILSMMILMPLKPK